MPRRTRETAFPLSQSSMASSGSTQRTKRRATTRDIVKMGQQPIPKLLHNTLKYAERVTISLDAGGRGFYNFSCNGLYDPNITGTGHQPLYFDQISALYDHYTVVTSSIEVNVGSNAANSFMAVLFVDDDATPGISPSGYVAVERTGAKHLWLTPGDDDTRMTAAWNAKKTFGGDPLAQSTLQGTASANPTEQSMYCIYIDGGVALSSGSVDVYVVVTYNVVWDEWTSIAGS